MSRDLPPNCPLLGHCWGKAHSAHGPQGGGVFWESQSQAGTGPGQGLPGQCEHHEGFGGYLDGAGSMVEPGQGGQHPGANARSPALSLRSACNGIWAILGTARLSLRLPRVHQLLLFRSCWHGPLPWLGVASRHARALSLAGGGCGSHRLNPASAGPGLADVRPEGCKATARLLRTASPNLAAERRALPAGLGPGLLGSWREWGR